MKWPFSLLLLALLLVSCSYKPPTTYSFENTRLYGLEFEAVWDKVVEWFVKSNVPIKSMEKGSGFIATEYDLDVRSYQQYCDCGKSGLYQSLSEPVGNLNVLVRTEGDSVKVTISSSFKSRLTTTDMQGENPTHNTAICTSKGVVERSILDYIGGA